MSTLKITGGRKIHGTVRPMPNKNSILKIIPACLLASETVTLHNVPKSSSVRIMLRVFRQLGGKVAYMSDNTVKLTGSTVDSFVVDQDLAMKERATLMFLGPLLARFGQAEISDSGGCKLGNRPLDTMFQGLRELGVKLDQENGYKVSAKELKGKEIWLLESSVTGTENLVLAAVLAKGTTTIYNAACEPHTQDLCNFLVSIGAQIEGIGTNKLVISGVEQLSGGEWTIIPDHIDIGGLIVAAAITGGELRIKNAIPEHMTQILNYFAKLNLKVEVDGNDLIVPGEQNLKAIPNLKGDIDKINDLPWPGFPVDLIPQALILALFASGSIRIYSNLYEVQLIELFAELFKMQAKMTMANPNMILTNGKSNLVGAKVNAASVLQSTHALFLAGLAANGTTTIENADIIARRYPELISTFTALGAKIEEL